MKNLDGLLKILQKTTANIILDIFGPIEDHEHWAVCQALIEKIPSSPSLQEFHNGILDIWVTFGFFGLVLSIFSFSIYFSEWGRKMKSKKIGIFAIFLITLLFQPIVFNSQAMYIFALAIYLLKCNYEEVNCLKHS